MKERPMPVTPENVMRTYSVCCSIRHHVMNWTSISLLTMVKYVHYRCDHCEYDLQVVV